MKVEFYYSQRKYECSIVSIDLAAKSLKELRIRNSDGEILAVQQGQRQGFRGKSRSTSQLVDISKPQYYNLVKAAVSALEIAEQKKLLEDKDEQIQLLNSEVDILKQKANLSTIEKEEIARLQAELKKLDDRNSNLLKSYDDKYIEQILQEKLSIDTWQCLEIASRKELCSAYKYRQLAESDVFTEEISDYRPSCLYLSNVIEREVIHTFFKTFHQFLIEKYSPKREFVVGGVVLKSKGKYTIGKLPCLISKEWQTFDENILSKEKLSSSDRANLYCKITDKKVSLEDSQLIRYFLESWQHPLANWLLQDSDAASKIDQISRLRNLNAHPNPIHKWQFIELWLLIMGGKTKSGREGKGILKEIYDRSLFSNF